jgi:hypothetical protein
MKDKVLNLEETEDSHTRWRWLRWVSEKRGDGEGMGSYVSSDTLTYINLAGWVIRLVALRGPMHLPACVDMSVVYYESRKWELKIRLFFNFFMDQESES